MRQAEAVIVANGGPRGTMTHRFLECHDHSHTSTKLECCETAYIAYVQILKSR